MLKDEWYVACASLKLGNDILATRVLDEPIAVFRDSDGTAKALLDRCCHRGYPVSKSHLGKDGIQCRYHGWKYDCEGRCVAIPSQAPSVPIPKSFKIKSFPCRESSGYVWIWMGENSPSKDVPTIENFAANKWVQGSCEIKANFVRGLEITFDMAHIQFVHKQHPFTQLALDRPRFSKKVEIRATARGCVAFAPGTKEENDLIPERCSKMEFILPDRIYFRIFNEEQVERIYFHVVPTSSQSCRMEWLLTNLDDSAPHILWDQNPPVILEDKMILEDIEPIYEKYGDSFEKHVAEDLATLTLRKIIEASSKNSWEGALPGGLRRIQFDSMTPLSLPKEL